MTNLPLTVPQILDVLELRTSRAAKIMFLTAALDDERKKGKAVAATLATPGLDCGACGSTFRAALAECPVCVAGAKRRPQVERVLAEAWGDVGKERVS